MLNFVEFLFFAVPIGAIVFFAVSLHRYRSAKEQNKQLPGSVSQEQMKIRKLLLILSSVIAGVLVLAVIGVIVTLFFAIAFM